MEREHTFGAVMVLVILFVIILIIFVMYPPLFEDIKQIAKESFGFIELEEEQAKREKREENVLGLMESIINCKAYLKEGEECLCKIETGDFSETTLGIEWKDNERIIRTYDKKAVKIDEKNMGRVRVCVVEEPKKTAETEDVIDIVYEDGKAKIKEREISDLLYVYDAKTMCFVLKEKEGDFYDIKSCETKKPVIEEKIQKKFDEFVEAYRGCLKLPIMEEACDCAEIDFLGIAKPYSFDITMSKGITWFRLLKGKTNVLRSAILEKGLGEGEAISLDGKYVIIMRGTKVEIDKKRKVLLLPLGGTGIKCKKEEINWGEYAEKNNCEERAKDEEHYKWIVERIKDKEYEMITRDGEKREKKIKESYLEIIEESLNDLNRKWYNPLSYFAESDKEEIGLMIGVIATESAGINFQEANEAGAKGLMQFTPGTAYDYGLCDRKKIGRKNGKDVYEYCTNRDERGDAAKAIKAAIRYLRDLKKNLENGNYCGKGYEQEENWDIGIMQTASYNSGPKPICDAIKKAEINKPGWLKVRESIKGYHETICYVYYVQDYKKNLAKYIQTYDTLRRDVA